MILQEGRQQLPSFFDALITESKYIFLPEKPVE